MQISIKARWAIFLLFFISLAPHAADLDELFVAETKVADEGSETRNAALRDLLAQVLARVSGNPAIGAQPAAVELLAAAPSLVQQFRYRSVDENGELSRLLWARFDRRGIERMMRERNLPVWVQRPQVLLWSATERQGQRELLNLDALPAVRDVATSRARALGMPLQLPLMDLEDQSALAPADLWSEFQSGIRAASARYPHQVILTARFSALGNDQWRGSWTLIGRDDRPSIFQTPVQGMADTLAAGIEQAQQLLAARYAPTPGVAGASGTLVRFSDVYDLPAYGRLVVLLEGLEPVAEVALRYVRDDALVFEFNLRGDVRDLERALETTGQFAAEAAPLPRFALPVPVPKVVPPTGQVGVAEPTPVPEYEADLYYRLLN